MQDSITDIHLSIDGKAAAVLFPFGGPMSSEHDEYVRALMTVIAENPKKKMVEAQGTRWRVQQMREGRYALRRQPAVCPDIDQLGLPSHIKHLLLQSSLKQAGGLILICGLTGAGKTTTFSATIAARLRLHGGYALTIEDPPENLLEGQHGSAGYCEQLDSDEIGGYETAVTSALRCFPAKDSSILGYGEVRDRETAAQLVRVAVNGHLVIFTLHAKSIPTGLQRLCALAKAAGEEQADDLVAASLQLALHQKFDVSGRLQVCALTRENKVVAHIRAGDFASLNNEVELTQLRYR